MPLCFGPQDQTEMLGLETCVFGRAVTKTRQQRRHQAPEGKKKKNAAT